MKNSNYRDDPSRYNAYDYNTKKLRQLAQELARAESRLEAAKALYDGLKSRQATFQAAASQAHTSLAQSAGALSAAQAAALTTEQLLPPSAEAAEQAMLINDSVTPLLAKARETANALIAAMPAIDVLLARVQERQGKNDPTPPLTIARTPQVKISAANAMNAICTAVQHIMLAIAAAEQALKAAEGVQPGAKRLRKILVDDSEKHLIATNGTPVPAKSSKVVHTVQEFAAQVGNGRPSVVSVLSTAAKLAGDIAAARQAAATTATLQLNKANADVIAASTESKRAQAAYAAVEAAVA